MRVGILAGVFCFLSLIGMFVASAAEPTPRWDEIVGPSRGQVTAPLEKVTWRNDLAAAMKEAHESDRPLFVTLRCLPCKQCSAFDKDVLEGGPDLDPLLKQ